MNASEANVLTESRATKNASEKHVGAASRFFVSQKCTRQTFLDGVVQRPQPRFENLAVRLKMSHCPIYSVATNGQFHIHAELISACRTVRHRERHFVMRLIFTTFVFFGL